MLCVTIALSACNSTGSKSNIEPQNTDATNSQSNVEPHGTNTALTNLTITSKPNLVFNKEGSGSSALKTAIDSSSNKQLQQLDPIELSYAADFVDEKLDLVRYSFGTNSSIYVADFKNALMFDYNKAGVRTKDKQLVNDFVQLYRGGTFGNYLYIIGHTDSDGSASYNYALSVRRASAVASILLNNDFPEPKLNLVPAGEYIPKVSNKTKSGKQQNRRVEIISADSRALIQAYLRQLQCPSGEKCDRKLLNVFDVRKNGKTAEMSLKKTQSFATFSPELSNLVKLDNALRNGSSSVEIQLLKNDDKRGLIKMGEDRQAFTIPIDVRPVLRIPKDVRRFRIPKEYIIHSRG